MASTKDKSINNVLVILYLLQLCSFLNYINVDTIIYDFGFGKMNLYVNMLSGARRVDFIFK